MNLVCILLSVFFSHRYSSIGVSRLKAQVSGVRNRDRKNQEDLRCCLLDEKSWFMIDSWAFPIFLGSGFRDEGPWNLFLIFRVKV